MKKENWLKKINDIINGNSKNKKINALAIIILLTIPIILSVYLRIQPYYLPTTDQWAYRSITAQIKSNIYNTISQKYPLLPSFEKSKLAEQEYQKFLSQNKNYINYQVKQLSNYFKEQLKSDEENTTYLIAIDPYHYYRIARNEITKGYPGDIKINDSYSVDYLMIGGAPIERKPKYYGLFTNTLDFLESRTYKILHALGFKPSLMQVAFFMPLILTTLAVIPAFFLGRKLSNNLGGFFTALIVAIHPFALRRTAAGFSDTDPFNLLFPLTIALFFIEAFESKTTKKRVIYSILTAISIWLYSISWGGFGSMVIILLGTLFLFILIKIIEFLLFKKNKENSSKELKTIFLVSLIMLISTWLLLSFRPIRPVDFTYFFRVVKGTLGFTQIKAVATTKIWPNVYTTVAELNPGKVSDIINSSGGKIVFSLSLIGILLAFIDKNKKINWLNGLLILIWYSATVYAVLKGVRFVLLVAPVFSVSLGLFFGKTIKLFSNIFEKWFEIKKETTSLILIIIYLMLIFAGPGSMFAQAKVVAYSEFPSMNDAWYNALTSIRDNSSKDAIITSWWDFGHWFKAIAQRQVTFDGASQNSPMAHWVGRSLLTNNETEALTILRMLDCGSNYAYELINKKLNDSYESVKLVKKVISLDKENARKLLLNYFDSEYVDKILNYTHCNPPEAFYITSEDMVGKAGVWAHFGSWNFEKAAMYKEIRKLPYNKAKETLINKFNLSPEDAEKYYNEIITTKNADYWVAPWPSYIGSEVNCKKNNNTLECVKLMSKTQGIRVLINLTSMDAYINEFGNKNHPSNFLYFDNGKEVFKQYKDHIVNIGVALKEDSDKYQIIISDPLLTNSLFSKLFFFKGQGTKYFKLFESQKTIFGERIYVWKVDWQKFLSDFEKE